MTSSTMGMFEPSFGKVCADGQSKESFRVVTNRGRHPSIAPTQTVTWRKLNNAGARHSPRPSFIAVNIMASHGKPL